MNAVALTCRSLVAILTTTTALLLAEDLHAQERYITVASTTSTEQSGLFGYLLPAFEKAAAIKVRIVALGTGQALDIGRRGDADVVFVHDKVAEEKFVAEGYGVRRQEVMYNDFVLVGPRQIRRRRRARTSWRGCVASRRRRPRSYRVATEAEHTPPNFATGRRLVSISTRRRVPGTATLVLAWARRSTWRPR